MSIKLIFKVSLILLLIQVTALTTFSQVALDDFPVTKEMLKKGSGPIKIAEAISIDKAWFQNEELKQTLIVELYTDYHRIKTYLIDNKNIPPSLIQDLDLHKSAGSSYEILDDNSKKKLLPEFITKAEKIDKKYFISNQGIKIGDNKAYLEKRYGKPAKNSISESIEILKWKFEADPQLTKSSKGKGKFAKDSFGYEITGYFKNNNLVAIILFKDIP